MTDWELLSESQRRRCTEIARPGMQWAKVGDFMVVIRPCDVPLIVALDGRDAPIDWQIQE